MELKFNMNYYLDTEFHEYEKEITCHGETFSDSHSVNTIELISIGIVSEDDREFYAVCKEFDVEAAWENEWLRENVLRGIYMELCLKELGSSPEEKLRLPKFTLRNLKNIIGRVGKSCKKIAEGILEFIYTCEVQNDIRYNLQTTIQKYLGEDRLQLLNLEDKCEPCCNISDFKNIEFYAYYADYDWVVFCWLFGAMMSLPKGYPMYCIDLKQELDRKVDLLNSFGLIQLDLLPDAWIEGGQEPSEELKLEWVKLHPNYPKQKNEHNALADAKWNKELHKFLNKI